MYTVLTIFFSRFSLFLLTIPVPVFSHVALGLISLDNLIREFSLTAEAPNNQMS